MRPWKSVKSICGIFDSGPNAFWIISSRFRFKRMTSSCINQELFTLPPVGCKTFLCAYRVMLQTLMLRPNSIVPLKDVPRSAPWNSDCSIWTYKTCCQLSPWRTEKTKYACLWISSERDLKTYSLTVLPFRMLGYAKG